MQVVRGTDLGGGEFHLRQVEARVDVETHGLGQADRSRHVERLHVAVLGLQLFVGELVGPGVGIGIIEAERPGDVGNRPSRPECILP